MANISIKTAAVEAFGLLERGGLFYIRKIGKRAGLFFQVPTIERTLKDTIFKILNTDCISHHSSSTSRTLALIIDKTVSKN